MSTITLRGIDENTAAALKERARQQDTSVNAVTLKILREALGLDKRKRQVAHTDLNHLAGTWSEEEFDEFRKHTAAFEEIDENLWGQK